MHRVINRRQWMGLLLAVAVGLSSGLARAADKKKSEPETPLLVVSVSSVERLLKGADAVFESAGRAELSETISGLLANANDLKGLHRDQPMGILLYLNGILPQPVGFVPVDNIDDLLKTVELAPVSTKKTGEDTYEIAGQRQTIHLKIDGAYAFLSNDSANLDRSFPDPAKITAKLSSAYDIAATVSLKSLPETTREILLTYIRTQAETDMQQRDNEPESAYRVRRAGAESNLELTEQIVNQAEEITLGWGVSSEHKNAGLELVVVATPGSDLAKICNELNGARSHFSNLLDTMKSPLTMSMAWKLSKSGRKFFEEVVKVSETEVRKSIGGEKGDDGPIIELFKVLKSTAEGGQLDAAIQFLGEPPGPFVLVGGVKIADADLLSTSLSQIVPRLKDTPQLALVEADIETYKGVTLHRLQGKETRPEDERIYGSKPSFYFGAGGKVLWFALGGDGAVAAIKKAIDEVEKPVADATSAVPFQFVINMASWMDIIDRGDNPNGLGSRARTAFSKGGDTLRIDARGIDNGVRFRLQFDEAFMRLLGGEIARRVDRGQ